ncbi:Phage-related protein [Luteibacter sp. UNC138MFCol5.1]|uniref:phage tail protein n=1 Tax=Luteibacter sp. UNC138MFCol5.1 TaxID=1502774 RepID=UPI0008BFED90|nr:phage tail protein [Luteibacter sp. UNC138MFCol5.1]SEO63319.1 Phage-related protein [Luteibacter sp. UNC138MFCol5.1]
MAETFPWRGIGQPAGQAAFRVLKSQFGDGYSQEAADGINNEVQTWPMQFVGSRAEVIAIRDFFRRHAGAVAFLWTPPLGEQGRYKVTSYSPVHQGGDVYTISATFEQKFSP